MKTFKKAFIVNTSAITNSLSPHYYHKERQRYIDIFLDDKYKFEIDKLKRLFYISSSKTSASNVNKYIGMANIQSNTGIYIESDEDKGSGNCSIFSKGDILFGKLRPYLNKVYLAEFDGGCTTEFIVLTSKDNSKVSNKFLSIFLLLDCVVNQTKHIMTGNTLPRIQTYDIENLLIPLPPLETQNKIISFMDNAYKIKRANEQKAKELLDSIDTYLLKELDITLPKEEKIVSFKVNSSDIFGNRFDPEYKIKINNLENLKGHYPFVELKHLMIGSAQYGANETAQEKLLENDVRYIRITDIDDIGNLKSVKMKTANNISEQYILNYNDILFARSGSVGRCYIHKNIEKKAIFAGYLIRFILDEHKINPNYFFFFCHSSIYKYWVSAIERPTVQSNINSQEYKSLKIPLPPLEIQTKIANHIQALREEAKQLQQEAKEVLASAKDEVEEIILGDK